jgi:hypothetical protein
MYHHCRDKYDQVSTRKPLGIMHYFRRYLTVVVISIVGAALIYTSNDLWTDFAGLALLGVYSTGMPLSLAMISSNIGGFTKRATNQFTTMSRIMYWKHHRPSAVLCARSAQI